MKLTYRAEAPIDSQYLCDPHTPARKAAIDAIRHWGNLAELVSFAEARHGYENTDGFFGITYPSDLDEHDRAEWASIPDGYVEANAWYGETAGETHLLAEVEYLELLRQFLLIKKSPDLARQIECMLRKEA